MYVVAHPDDDLLFMNPDIQTSIRQGNEVVVIVENGGAHTTGEVAQYWIDRERGNINAYGYMARPADPGASFANFRGTPTGDPRGIIPSAFTRRTDPGATYTTYAAMKVAQFDITADAGNRVTLIYPRVADSGVEGLWNNAGGDTRECPTTTACNEVPVGPDCDPDSACTGGADTPKQDITRQDLIDFYLAVMDAFHVTSVSTLDSTNVYMDATGGQGDLVGWAENADHYYSALFAITAATKLQALPTTTRTISLRLYRGYTINPEPQNLMLGGPEQLDKFDAFARYAMFDAAALFPQYAWGSPTEISPLDGPTVATQSDYWTDRRYGSGPDPYIKTLFYGADNYESKKYATRTVVGTGAITGRLQNGFGTCLLASLSSGSCATAPEWVITDRNQIQLAGTNQCLSVTLQGSGNYITSPKLPAEPVVLADCSSGDRVASTMFLFGNGQIRTANGRCLSVTAPLASDDCMAVGGGPLTVASITASSTTGGHGASKAIDNNLSTSWVSDSTGSQWISAYLGSTSHGNLGRIELEWGVPFATEYVVEGSEDNFTWTRLYQVPDAQQNSINGNGRLDVIELPGGGGKYVRVTATQRSSTGGFTLKELRITEHVAGITPSAQDWTLLFGPLQFKSSLYDDNSGTGAYSSYYKTLGIVNRDICVRQFSGVWCTEWNGSGLNPPYQIDSGFSNANGWLAAENGDTVRGVWYGAGGWPPIACGRGYWGASCTNGFSTSAFSTPSGWNQPYFYETIRYIDLKQNGRVDVCGRGAGGIVCTVSNGSSWGPATLWTPAYDNVNGWTDMTNASTIQFADISGDGKLDVCGRSDYGMLCSVADRFVDSFINTHYWSFDNDRTGLTTTQRDFADSDLGINWASSASYYDSIRLVDVNRDGFADACGRGPQGIYCALSTGTSFERKKLVAPDVTDVGGWGAANTGGTLSFGDLNASARVDACLRGNAGIYCTEGY